MRKKIIFLLFFCCLAKLYHIADRRMDFSLDLLINSFTVSAAEQSSLGQIADDVVLIKNIFLNKNVSEFMLSEDILRICPRCSHRIIEFIYPIKIKQNAAFLVAYKNDDKQKNCELISFTKSYNIYECK